MPKRRKHFTKVETRKYKETLQQPLHFSSLSWVSFFELVKMCFPPEVCVLELWGEGLALPSSSSEPWSPRCSEITYKLNSLWGGGKSGPLSWELWGSPKEFWKSPPSQSFSIVPVLLLALMNVAQARKWQKAFVCLEDQEPVKESYVQHSPQIQWLQREIIGEI